MTENQPRVCHVIASINEATGGTAVAATNYATALSKQGIICHLFTLDYSQCGEQVPVEEVKLHSYPATLMARYLRGFQPSASRALWQLASTELDLIHNYGLWMFTNIYARQSAVGNHLPLIISPEGMLESWSLKRSWVKKWLAWFLYERANIVSANVFHATSTQEVNSIRSLSIKQPIALIPHGVHCPRLDQQHSREILTRRFSEIGEKQWLLFMSRLHPKKGLDNLLYVWQKLETKFPDWHLLIAGPDWNGYQAKLESLVADLALNARVTFTGMLSGEKKEAAFANADLFVLPTHSENFGNVVPESLAYAVPVVTTKGAPWQELSTYECGWWIEDSQQALASALAEGMQMSSSERKAMGLRGRRLVETKYSWDFVAQEMVRVYSWVLGESAPPSCVQFASYR